MPRRVEDIIRSDKRSIRDIQPAAAKTQASKPEKVREVSIHKLRMTPPIHIGGASKSFSEPKKRKLATSVQKK